MMENIRVGLELMVVGAGIVFVVLFFLMYLMKWMSVLVNKWTKN